MLNEVRSSHLPEEDFQGEENPKILSLRLAIVLWATAIPIFFLAPHIFSLFPVTLAVAIMYMTIFGGPLILLVISALAVIELFTKPRKWMSALALFLSVPGVLAVIKLASLLQEIY